MIEFLESSTQIVIECKYKVYAKSGCTCCWYCSKCGKTGCDNLIYGSPMGNFKKIKCEFESKHDKSYFHLV